MSLLQKRLRKRGDEVELLGSLVVENFRASPWCFGKVPLLTEQFDGSPNRYTTDVEHALKLGLGRD